MERLIQKAFTDERTKVYHIFNDIMGLIILSSVVSIILESVVHLEETYRQIFVWSEMVFVSIFTLEYALRIYYAEDKLKYLVSPLGLVDLLAILPSYLFFLHPFLFDFQAYRTLRALRVLRLFRLFRIFKIIAYAQRNRKETSQILQSIPWYHIEIYLFALMSVIIMSGTLVYLAEFQVPNTPFTNIPNGLWWAVVTVTTVGYGDMVPVTIFGRIVAVFTMIAGLTLFALLITVMGRLVHSKLFGVTPSGEFSYPVYFEEEALLPDSKNSQQNKNASIRGGKFSVLREQESK